MKSMGQSIRLKHPKVDGLVGLHQLKMTSRSCRAFILHDKGSKKTKQKKPKVLRGRI